jgi:hypothetical protein
MADRSQITNDPPHSLHYPTVNGTYYGRHLATVATEEAQWIAVQTDRAGENDILLVSILEGQRREWILQGEGFIHRPALALAGDGGASLIWNEIGDDGPGAKWFIRCMSLDRSGAQIGEVEHVTSGASLCLPPTIATIDDRQAAAWPAKSSKDGTIHIEVSERRGARWSAPQIVSAPGSDAFRPSLAACGGRAVLAWDQYNGERYQIVIAERGADGWMRRASLGKEGERWLHPQALVTKDGRAFITWVVLREVEDSLGIIDHAPFAMVAELTEDGVQILSDPEHAADTRIVADLREGLLAEAIYFGYAGLRRNPTLSVNDGALWCLWEVRIEQEETAHYGHLVGRKRLAHGTWTPAQFLHDGCINYAVGSVSHGGEIPIAYIDFPRSGRDAIGGKRIALGQGQPYPIEDGRWQRWLPTQIRVEPAPRQPIETGQGTVRLFWADTHCHSVFSPDAEGEVDELIHFGRDVAKLDALCIVDNDCYPHKSLTEAEWQIHQSFSEHFTDPGRFVLFPGWEFTYHRPDRDPGFNHRWVLYPTPGGRLYRRIDVDADTDEKLIAQLAEEDVVCVPHHCIWDIIDPNVDRNVEVCSSWRLCIEESDFIRDHLAAGARFGFVAASDSHRALPGLGGALTGIYASDLTPEALYEAYRQRRTIATQGFRLFVDFRADEQFIGAQGRCQGAPTLISRVEAPRPIEFVDIVRDGVTVHTTKVGERTCATEWTDQATTSGEHSYYLRIKLIGDASFNYDPARNVVESAFTQEGRYPGNLARAQGVFAWTSPIWLSVDVAG